MGSHLHRLWAWTKKHLPTIIAAILGVIVGLILQAAF